MEEEESSRILRQRMSVLLTVGNALADDVMTLRSASLPLELMCDLFVVSCYRLVVSSDCIKAIVPTLWRSFEQGFG